jgi:hypothetical protein
LRASKIAKEFGLNYIMKNRKWIWKNWRN